MQTKSKVPPASCRGDLPGKDSMKTKTLTVLCQGKNVITPMTDAVNSPIWLRDDLIIVLNNCEIGDILTLPSGRYRVRSIASGETAKGFDKTINLEKFKDSVYGFQEAESVKEKHTFVLIVIDENQALLRANFRTECEDAKAAEEAARKAVASFLSTKKGKDLLRDKNGRFDWKDAIAYVPEETWKSYGLHPHYPCQVFVEDRENLAEKKG